MEKEKGYEKKSFVADATIPRLKQEYASNRNMPW
jgi:hypothetical protein